MLTSPAHLCSVNPTTSTKRDAILMFVGIQTLKARAILSSLRAVNPRCTIVIMFPMDQLLPEDFLYFCIDLKCELYSDQFSDDPRFAPAPHVQRYLAYSKWTKAHINDYDRVFHVDAFDSFFQGDIFTDEIVEPFLHIAKEGTIIANEAFTSGWVTKCYGSEPIPFLNPNYIICSGTFGGPIKIFDKVIDIMFNKTRFFREECIQLSFDQAHFNMLIWTNILRLFQIPFQTHDCASGIVTGTYCCRDFSIPIQNDICEAGRSDDFGFLQYIYGKGKEPPVLFHQYDRFSTMRDKVNEFTKYSFPVFDNDTVFANYKYQYNGHLFKYLPFYRGQQLRKHFYG